jgi:hypothetical protein
MEKITTFIAYWLAVGLAYFGQCRPKKWRCMWVVCAPFTAAVNFWYRRKTFRYLTEMGIDKGDP